MSVVRWIDVTLKLFPSHSRIHVETIEHQPDIALANPDDRIDMQPKRRINHAHPA